MRTRMTIGGVLLLMMIAMTPGCEDSDVTAPDGSTITLIPAPASVFIDEDAGDVAGTTTLIAQVVDQGGLPLANIPLFFTTNGGLLATVANLCIGNVCSRTETNCNQQLPCADVIAVPTAVETNNSGVATDTLLLRLIEDPDTVEVTVQGTNLTAVATVTKTVNNGTNPVASIAMSPSLGQLTGEIFLADGTGSTFDPNAEPTCYEWTINSSLPTEPSVVRRGPNLSFLDDLVFGQVGDATDEQTLTISLRVSDRPIIDCSPNGAPDPDLFSDFPASVTYLIRCDLTGPQNVDAGPNRFLSLSGSPTPPTVSVALSATGTDPEFPLDLKFSWTCQDAIMIDPPDGVAESVTCTYDTLGVFTAIVTVENQCGLSTQDSLTVTVNP